MCDRIINLLGRTIYMRSLIKYSQFYLVGRKRKNQFCSVQSSIFKKSTWRRRLKQKHLVLSMFTVHTEMEWSRGKIIELIKEFEKHELLWNVGLTEYKDIAKKKDAWHDIAQKLGLSTVDVEQKMKSILAAYRREKRKVINRKKLASTTDAMYEPKWFAYKHMQFLYNITKSKRTTESFSLKKEYCRNVSDVCDSNKDENGDGSRSRDFHNEGNEDSQRREKEPERKKLKHSDKTEVALDTIQAIIRERTEKPKDECSTFGEMVAHKLRKLPSDYHRTLAQQKIDDILYNMLIEVLRGKNDAACPEQSLAS